MLPSMGSWGLQFELQGSDYIVTHLSRMGLAYRYGVQEGDVLLSVNGKDISTTEDVLKLDEDSIYELEFMNQDKERMRFIFE